MYRKVKISLLYVFICSIVVVPAVSPAPGFTISKAEAQKYASSMFVGLTSLVALEFAFLDTFHRSNKHFLTELKSPDLWIGSAMIGGCISGLSYLVMYMNSSEKRLEYAASIYNSIAICSVYNNRNETEAIFCQSVVAHGFKLMSQEASMARKRSFSNSSYMNDSALLAILQLGLSVFATINNFDDARGDLMLLYVTHDLVEMHNNAVKAHKDLQQLAESLDQDDPLMSQCQKLVDSLTLMILDLKGCIARIVGTKQWFDLILDAEVILNGTTGTKTIPIKFTQSICEGIQHFDHYYNHYSDVRKSREQKSTYIRFTLADDIKLKDWSEYYCFSNSKGV